MVKQYVVRESGVVFGRNDLRFCIGDEIIIILPCSCSYAQGNPTLQWRMGDGIERSEPIIQGGVGDGEIKLTLSCSGTLKIFISCTRYDNGEILRSKSSYALVHGVTKSGVCPESLSIITCISSRLGNFSNWSTHLNRITQTGYNAVHLTPLCQPGASHSSYSIKRFDQLNSRFVDHSGQGISLKDVLNKYHGVSFFNDIVLNHGSFDNSFIQAHPHAGYNQENSPWLNAAIEVDLYFKDLTSRIINGEIEHIGPNIDCINHIAAIVDLVRSELDISEWFALNIEKSVASFESGILQPTTRTSSVGLVRGLSTELSTEGVSMNRTVEQEGTHDELLHQLERDILHEVGVEKNIVFRGSQKLSEKTTPSEFRSMLERIQISLTVKHKEVFESILKTLASTLQYERITQKKHTLTMEPWGGILPRYFTEVEHDGKKFYLVNNGWVMNWSSQKSFCDKGEFVYLSRSLVAWSDCVKFRYHEDCPELYEYMKSYVADIAATFDGVRIDNCHSLRPDVGKIMINHMRQINPNLIVMAELFTGNPGIDKIYGRALGIDLIVRECLQMNGIAELVHGAMTNSCRNFTEIFGNSIAPISMVPNNAFGSGKLESLPQEASPCSINSISSVILYDCTHDNRPLQKQNRSRDPLIVSALATFAGCAYGSSYGYDMLLPYNPTVFDNGLSYDSMFDTKSPSRSNTFSILHQVSTQEETLTVPGYTLQSTAHLMSPSSVFSEDAQFTVFYPSTDPNAQVILKGPFDNWSDGYQLDKFDSSTQCFYAQIDKAELAKHHYIGKFMVNGNWEVCRLYEVVRDENGIENNLLTDKKLEITIEREKATLLALREWNHRSHVVVRSQRICNSGYCLSKYDLSTGEGIHCVVKCGSSSMKTSNVNFSVQGDMQSIVLNSYIDSHGLVISLPDDDERLESANIGTQLFISIKNLHPGHTVIFKTTFERIQDELLQFDAVNSVSLLELNYLLWSCNQEEADRSNHTRSVYTFPDIRPVMYAGIAGTIDAINESIKILSDLHREGNPTDDIGFFRTLNEGEWLLNYHSDRFRDTPFKSNSSGWIMLRDQYEAARENIGPLRMYDCYRLFKNLYSACIRRILSYNTTIEKMSLGYKDPLIHCLLVASTQFTGVMGSSRMNDQTGFSTSAGLPWFTTNYMREWGRDTALSIPGLFISTGRYEECEQCLLAFLGVLRHYQIPNLLDSSINPRYNARDAVWFLLWAITEYCKSDGDWAEFLLRKVQMQYYGEDKSIPNAEMSVIEIIIHILQGHYDGIDYREWNAGKQIDECMNDPGFNISIHRDMKTGFLMGGNASNCLTWMDKMGSSTVAGNSGIPSTPRCGAPVELTAINYQVLEWLLDLNARGIISLNSLEETTFSDWRQSIYDHFSKEYYVKSNDDSTNSGFIRDVINKHFIESEMKLRPNASIALAIAPQLMRTNDALMHLINSYHHLLADPKQVGIKTLSVKDPMFNGYYDNSNNSTDPKVAHGANYHQGPEWVWPFGFWCLAMVKIARRSDKEARDRLMYLVSTRWQNLGNKISEGPWYSLPELTQLNGEYCRDGCQAQAWSIASFLFFFSKLLKYSEQLDD